MKHEPLIEAGFKYLLVPALNHKMADQPLKYVDSLVYGLLIYRTQKSKRERVAGVGRRLGIDRSTACSSLKKLLQLGCVELHPDGYEAVEPEGACRELFTWKTNRKDEWHLGFAYDVTFLPAEASGLTIIQNAIYWRLVSLSVAADGGCGHLMIGPGACRTSLSNMYLANGLRCSRKTVATGLKFLEAQQMIHLHRVGDGRRFQVGFFPLAQHMDKWRKNERKVEAVTYEDLFGCTTNAPLLPDKRFESKIFELLRRHGIPNALMAETASLVNTYCIPDSNLQRIVSQVKVDHNRNRQSRPSLPDHCGSLLVAELSRRGAAGEWRIYEGIKSKVLSLAEMEMRAYLNGLRICSNAYILLRELSDNPSVKLPTGQRIPVAFCWDRIWQMAKRAGEDFQQFKQSVIEYLFPSSRRQMCDWLKYWTECDVVPRVADWPNQEIPLPKRGRGFVETVRNWAQNGYNEIESAEITNLFIQWIERQQDCKWHQKPTSNMSHVLRLFERWKKEILRDSEEGLIDQFF